VKKDKKEDRRSYAPALLSPSFSFDGLTLANPGRPKLDAGVLRCRFCGIRSKEGCRGRYPAHRQKRRYDQHRYPAPQRHLLHFLLLSSRAAFLCVGPLLHWLTGTIVEGGR
jgi:hypothetical protein